MLDSYARHDALNSLNVKSWYCKYVLPNAAASPVLVSPIVEVTGEGVSTLSNAQKLSFNVVSKAQLSNGSVSKSGVDYLLSNLTEVSEKSLVVDSTMASDLTKILSTKLSLSATRFDKYLILHELADVGDQDNLEELLLDAIIHALDGDISKRQKGLSLFWPAFESEALLKGQELFFEAALRRWLERLEWSDFNFLFYFGQNFDGIKSILLNIKVANESKCCVSSFGFSLSQILSSPIKKKKLWELISEVGVVGG